MEYERRNDRQEKVLEASPSIVIHGPEKHGKEVSGYRAAKEEKDNNLIPVEALRMRNAEGYLSVGVNRKEEITVAITKTSPVPMLRKDQAEVSIEGAKKMGSTEQIYTNSHNAQLSGILYKEDLKKSPSSMLEALKEGLLKQENEVAASVTPFLLQTQELEEKKNLEEYLRSCIEGGNQEAYSNASKALNMVKGKLARKEMEERRLLQSMTSTVETMWEQVKHLKEDDRGMFTEAGQRLREAGDEKSEADDDAEDWEEGSEDV